MLARALSGGLEGVGGLLVEVEACLSNGLVGFDIVGLPGAAVKESRDRIHAAIVNSGFPWPMKKLTVNLAPADVRKEGTSLELAIAMALLAAQQPQAYPDLTQVLLLGELTLHGELLPVRGALSMALAARDAGVRALVLPRGNAREVQCLADLQIFPADTLQAVVAHLRGTQYIAPQEQVPYERLLEDQNPEQDLRFVRGQKIARRALEVAAAGGHNLLMVGSPGSGKTMLARCLPGILPPLSYAEALETTCIHSAAGELPRDAGLMTRRPFRSPHHNASLPAIIGGGAKARPGEVSLAHNGVLFLDELPQYQRQTLEALRQPLEDGYVNVTRVSGQARYQSRCMLIAGMNPCPCGNYGSKTTPCRCKPYEIQRYLARISGPLLDRIDMQVEMDAVTLDEIEQSEPQEDSRTVQKRVLAARERQLARYAGRPYFCNAHLPQEGVETHCALTREAQALLRRRCCAGRWSSTTSACAPTGAFARWRAPWPIWPGTSCWNCPMWRKPSSCAIWTVSIGGNMLFTQEQRRLLWLSAAEITADRVQRMLEQRGSAQALWEDFSAGIALSANAEANRFLTRYHSELALDALCERLEKKKVTPLFLEDDRYPPLLKCIDDPPYVLYTLGDPAVLSRPSVAVVGTRYPSGYGRNMARSIAYGLAGAGLSVVSGMARGIDGNAHEGAIDAGGPSVAVLGSGVNVPYPLDNIGLYRTMVEGAGAVVSEYPLDATPQTYHFPHRNRVISGLCHAIVFVEGKVKSGGMITVSTALQQGRDVFAVPGCVGQAVSEGPHAIIREGARLVTGAADILLDLGLEPAQDLTAAKRDLPPEGENPTQRAILKALLREPAGMDSLCEQTGLPAEVLMAELSVMEIMGQVRRDSGNIFAVAIRTARTE